LGDKLYVVHPPPFPNIGGHVPHRGRPSSPPESQPMLTQRSLKLGRSIDQNSGWRYTVVVGPGNDDWRDGTTSSYELVVQRSYLEIRGLYRPLNTIAVRSGVGRRREVMQAASVIHLSSITSSPLCWWAAPAGSDWRTSAGGASSLLGGGDNDIGRAAAAAASEQRSDEEDRAAAAALVS